MAHVHVFIYVSRPSGSIIQKCPCGALSPNPPLMIGRHR